MIGNDKLKYIQWEERELRLLGMYEAAINSLARASRYATETLAFGAKNCWNDISEHDKVECAAIAQRIDSAHNELLKAWDDYYEWKAEAEAELNKQKEKLEAGMLTEASFDSLMGLI